MESSADSVLGNYVDYGSPPGVHVSVGGRCYDLVQLMAQFLGLHPFSIVGLADGHQLLVACASALESPDHTLGADGVVAGQYGDSFVEAGNYGLDDP